MFIGYEIPDGVYDEYFIAPGKPRPHVERVWDDLVNHTRTQMQRLKQEAEKSLTQSGITFLVYGDAGGTEKIMPFDILPRIVDEDEWKKLSAGLRQRIYALNLFLQDIYNDKKILKDKVVPTELIQSSAQYRPWCEGFTPPKGIWIHVTGTDLVRGGDGHFYVLEDNLRCPSGVSYMLVNRELSKRMFPGIVEKAGILPVEQYPDYLQEVLEWVSPGSGAGRLAVLTPGIYNSAYFEHSFLARKMGLELVEGFDLAVQDDRLFVKTTRGLEPVDGLYRRIDDDFLDPEVFRPDSCLGVRGLMRVYRKGRLGLANAPGTGIADDKAVYAWVPDIIRYYLGEEPILPNVPTYTCFREDHLKFVLENLPDLVVKAVNESGGYGMLLGPMADSRQIEEFRARVAAEPRKYIAQPLVELSQSPTLIGDVFEGRRVDLRPYILYGKEIRIVPGALTRVALKRGSLVVNSSQGGGSKDTWVLQRRDAC